MLLLPSESSTIVLKNMKDEYSPKTNVLWPNEMMAAFSKNFEKTNRTKTFPLIEYNLQFYVGKLIGDVGTEKFH